MKMIKFILLFLLTALQIYVCAQPAKQKYATQLFPLHDTTIAQFTNIYNFLPLYTDNLDLRKSVHKILTATSFKQQEKYLNKILNTKTSGALCLLAFDYYFQRYQPVKGSNVEQFLHIIQEHALYSKINTTFQYNLNEQDHLKDSVWKKIGWQFGYGSFYYLSPEDSLYMKKMTKLSSLSIDDEVIRIIERYLEDQGAPFRYDANAMVNEITQLTGIVHVIHDGCLNKTMQLPNWDNIYVVYVNGKDTLERCYTMQIGNYYTFRFLKRIPIFRVNRDEVYFKKADYCLHGYARVKEQCEKNRIEKERIQFEYNEYLKNKKE